MTSRQVVNLSSYLAKEATCAANLLVRYLLSTSRQGDRLEEPQFLGRLLATADKDARKLRPAAVCSRSMEELIPPRVEKTMLLLVRAVPAFLDGRIPSRNARGDGVVVVVIMALPRPQDGAPCDDGLAGPAGHMQVGVGLDFNLAKTLELAAHLQAVQQVSATPALESCVEPRDAVVEDAVHSRNTAVHAVHGPCCRKSPSVEGVLRSEQAQLVCQCSLSGLRVGEVVCTHWHQQLLKDPLLEVKDCVEPIEAPAEDLFVVGRVQLHEDAVCNHRKGHRRRRKHLLETQVETCDSPRDGVIDFASERVHLGRRRRLLSGVSCPRCHDPLLLVAGHELRLRLDDVPHIGVLVSGWLNPGAGTARRRTAAPQRAGHLPSQGAVKPLSKRPRPLVT
mmetsp:Transcript_99089/g.275914  ORF Transcript_99089/g.275914 Transcript_99089/m.275914 type:complete len:393 (+) Transcript_99089:1-1179(+)